MCWRLCSFPLQERLAGRRQPPQGLFRVAAEFETDGPPTAAGDHDVERRNADPRQRFTHESLVTADLIESDYFAADALAMGTVRLFRRNLPERGEDGFCLPT